MHSTHRFAVIQRIFRRRLFRELRDEVFIRELLCGGEEDRPVEAREHAADEQCVEVDLNFIAGVDVEGERISAGARALQHIVGEETHYGGNAA